MFTAAARLMALATARTPYFCHSSLLGEKKMCFGECSLFSDVKETCRELSCRIKHVLGQRKLGHPRSPNNIREKAREKREHESTPPVQRETCG